MKITSVRARDFLSFSDFTLDDIGDQLTVIVGPNGSGKSNVLRILDLTQAAVEWSDSTGPRTSNHLREYTEAVRIGSSTSGFRVEVGITLDQPAEHRLLLSWLRAAVLMTFLADEQSHRDNAELTRFLVDTIDETEAQPLFTGTLVVSYELPPADGFTVGYEFDVAGERYCYVMHGPRSRAIARGELDPRSVSSYSGQRGRSLLLDEDSSAPPLDETDDKTFTFELSRLLPKGDSVTQLGVSSLHLGLGNPIIDDFLRRYTLEVNTSRLYSLATPLTRITRELTLLKDRRGKPRQIYRASELNRLPTSRPPVTDLPLELLRLKLGTATERDRYSEIQTTFEALAEASFDLQAEQLSTPGAAEETVVFVQEQRVEAPSEPSFRIDVRIKESAIDVPLEFAGAGRWEALILSTTLTNANGIAVLDEPATSLNGTLQRRLLDQLRHRIRQTIVITHSPFLVPASRLSLESIIRLKRPDGLTVGHRLRKPLTAESKSAQKAADKNYAQQLARLEQMLGESADARALLFAEAVILVEGETERGALERWLPRTSTAGEEGAPEDLNLAIASVGGDSAFGAFTRYLDTFAIPWVILCDGKACSPDYANALTKQIPMLEGVPPENQDAFTRWKSYWQENRVFTLAESFDDEIEAFFERIDREAYVASQTSFAKSKVRSGYKFAASVPCPRELDGIYAEILESLELKRNAIAPRRVE